MEELEICIYDRVTLSNQKQGEVQFIGMLEGKDGIYYGVKLDGPDGKNDGSVGSVKYFDCFEKYGIFVTTSKIKKSEMTQLNSVLPRVCIGDRIYVKQHQSYGILRFVGNISDKDGCWYGVELEDPLGEHNGSLDDRQYFECGDYCGIFCEAKHIESKRAPKKFKIQSSSEQLALIKSNYNQNNTKSKPAAPYAPPPPMPEPETKKPLNLMEVDIETMNYIQLRERCSLEGLATFGNKRQMLDRLRHHLSSKSDANPSSSTNTALTDSQIPKSPSIAKSPSSFDPDLHDIPPEKDDFYQPIATSADHNFDPREIGSVIYNPDAARSVQPMQPLQPLNSASRSIPSPNANARQQPQEQLPSPTSPLAQPAKSNPLNAQSHSSPTRVGSPSPSSVPTPSSGPTSPPMNGQQAGPPSEWVMIADPSSGQMYFANLRTKETRWDAPVDSGWEKAEQNPVYDPALQHTHPATNQGAEPFWQQTQIYSQSGRNLTQQPGYPQQHGYPVHHVSPFNQAPYPNPYGNYPQSAQQQFQQQGSTQSAQRFPGMRPGGTSPNQMGSSQKNVNQMPTSSSAPSMMLNGNSSNKSDASHKRRVSNKQQPTKPLPLVKSSSASGSADPLAMLEAKKWKKVKDKNSGREYWYHKETKQTTWDTPPAVLKVNAAESTIGSIAEMEEIGKADWEEVSDSDYSSSGSYYSDGSESEEEDEIDDFKDFEQQGGGGGNPHGNMQGQQGGNAINYPYPAQGQPPSGWIAPNQQQQQPQQPWNGVSGVNGQNATFQQPQAWNSGAYPMQQGQQRPGPPYQQSQHGQPGQQGQGSQPQIQGPQSHPYSQRRQAPTMEKRNSARQMYLKPSSQLNVNPQQIEEKAAEDNPWISAEEAKSRVIVRDTLKRYWQIGAQQKFNLEGWAKKNYNLAVHRKGLFNKTQQTITDVVSYCEFGKVKHPLNRKADGEEKTRGSSMQTWKNINSYMGIRKSGKAAEGHVEKLVRFALKGDDTLRDEIYCQLAKQTTKNPKLQSLLKGWKLLLICCSFFPPSSEFVDYLACFIWNNTQQPTEIGQYAIKALHALDATMLSGARKQPPLPLEIVKLEHLQPIPLNIYFINGMRCKQVLVTSQTRAKQVIETLAQTFNFKHPEAFGLYEMEPHIPPLDKRKKHYLQRELMEQQEKINDLSRMPFERELEDDDRMLDVIASWLKRDQSKRKKGDGGDGRSGGKKKRYKSNKNVRFVIKVKTFRKSMEKHFCSMGAKANFLTHVWHVVNDYYPLNPSDPNDLDLAFDLAALQLQGTFGQKPKMPAASKFDPKMDAQKAFYSPGLIALDLHKYLGQAVLKKYLPQDRAGCEMKILQVRATKFSKLKRAQCWLMYAKKLRSHNNREFHQYFGAAWYRGVRIEGGGQDQVNRSNKSYKSKQPNALEQKGKSITTPDRTTNDLLVGINEAAITFVNPITQSVVARYQMEEILTFGYRSNAFLFVAGTLMTQTKMQIATMHGKAMNRLVRTHIDLRVRDAEKKGQR